MKIGYTHPNRLPRINKEELDEKDKEIFDLIDKTRGGVWGPYTALMQVPDLANRVAAVGEYLRFHGKLPGAEREFAILCSAKENNSKFEWIVHEPVARNEGTKEEVIDYLRTGKETNLLTSREDMIAKLIRSLCREKTVNASIYNDAQVLFSKDELIEIVTIAGFYQLLSYVISAFDVPDPSSDLPSF